jgi:histidinol-phosphate aminotransferase
MVNDQNLLEIYFSNDLRNKPFRINETNNKSSAGNQIQLDKNEQPNDVPFQFKQRILCDLILKKWNRYPANDFSMIEDMIANYCSINSDNIVIGQGAAALLTVLLNYFSINKKKIIITQPSYSLFEYHCTSYGIPFHPWYLNHKLEYDEDNLPELDQESVVFLASPNNPIGNIIEEAVFELLLAQNRNTIFVLDAVYQEYSDQNFTTWVNKYPNLIVIRSFSKAFPIAGLRLGYLCSNKEFAQTIKKLVLPFSITEFSLEFAKNIVFDTDFFEWSRKSIEIIKKSRDRIIKDIEQLFNQQVLRVIPSQGNFILCQTVNSYFFNQLMNEFKSKHIKVLDTSNNELIPNSFRISIGNEVENKQLLKLFYEFHDLIFTQPKLS